MASGSRGGAPVAPAAAASAAGGGGGDCESCHAAPGVPFCRVEWSFLCPTCASVVHANNWIIAVPPNPNPNSNPFPFPYPHIHPFPNPNAASTSDPNLIVHLSSDDGASGGGRSGRKRSVGRGNPPVRVESVMRYREKRKNRRFDKNVRYENRKVYAELRPRVEGKFARPEEAGEAVATAMPVVDEGVMPASGEQAGQEVSEEVLPFES